MHHRPAKSQAGQGVPKTRGRTITWARYYDVVSWVFSLGRGRAILRTAIKLAGVTSGDNVLDVGCGTGSLALDVKAKVGVEGGVQGLDAAPEMIEVARRKAAKKGADIGFHVALIEEIPFPDGEFDVVFSTFMLHHLPDDLKREGFAEIRRVLKPGGRFMAVDFSAGHPSLIGHIASLFGHGSAHEGVSELEGMLDGAGFTDVEKLKTKYRQLAFIRAKADKATGNRG